MGFFKDILGVAAPVVGGIFGGPVGSAIGGALGGALTGSSNAKAAAQGTTTTQQLDPRINSILFGANNNGLLNQFQGFANQGPSAAAQNLGQVNGNYLNQYAGGDMGAVRDAGYGLLQGNAAPQSAFGGVAQPSVYGGAAPSAQFGGQAQAAQFGGAAPDAQFGGRAHLNAPAQNNLNLSDAYSGFINGNSASNPLLSSALQAGVNATNAGFATNQGNVTNALQRNVLPGLKSNAIASGGFGGSRQGIAEGLALSDYTNQLTNANTQLAATNSANVLGQQAASFNAGEDRRLNALNTLSGQQYGAAAKAADLEQQANQMLQQNSQFNSGQKLQANQMNQQNSQFNSTQQQHAMDQNQANSQFNSTLAYQNNAMNQANGQFNATLQQQGNQLAQQNGQFNATQQSNTNQQNNAAALSGAGLIAGQLGTATNGLQNWDNFGINRAQQTAGLLAPFIGVNGSTNSTQPYYNNTAGNVLGGAAGALSLYNQFSGIGNNAAASQSTGGSFGGWGF